MGRDFKIGLIAGILPALAVVVWVATRPGLTPEARMRRAAEKNQAESSLEEMLTPEQAAPSGMPRRFDGTAAPVSGNESAPAAGAPPVERETTAPVPTPATAARGQSQQPDSTIYEQAEKIKTTRFHIVQRNETLSAIAQQYYGTASSWRKIVEANRDVITDANRISPGTKLIIPD